MNHTTALIAQVEFLIQQLAGTEVGESQTVIEINDLIGKVKKEQLYTDIYEQHLLRLKDPSYKDHFDRFNLAVTNFKNPKNPE